MAEHLLPQSAGYGVVIGMGLFFSLFMMGLTRLQTRYTSYKTTSAEEFNSASRSVKPGLIAAGIVSAWTWAATLLQSSAVAYKYGISGPWWYATGACVQVLLFAMIAAKLKQNAPYAHTFLEIIKVRWGKTAHIVFTIFGLATNAIVSAMLILGGSATVTDLTGMNTLAACFLIPTFVALYVVSGGIRATLLADYTHTAVLFAIILTFVFSVHATSDKIGSVERMHELLDQATRENPVAGNAGGSYLTMRSKNGLIFGVINLVGNFGTVFADQAYWQRAIASQPASCVKAYLLGGLAWFAIPFCFATTLGLAAVALSHGANPLITMTAAEVSAGLPAPKAAGAVLGQSGAVAMLILLFLAVTSAAAAEMIAVSTIFTYNIYATYINKRPTERKIVWVSQISIGLSAIMMALLGLIFHFIGVSMGYLYMLMGTIIGCAVVPIAFCVTWKKANGTGCMVGAVTGFCSGIIGWLVCTAKLNDGVISVVTSGGDYEMLTGNLLSLGVGGIISLVWSLVSPADFDWSITRNIKTADEIEAEFHIAEVAAADTPNVEKSQDESKMEVTIVRSASPSIASKDSYTETEEFKGLVKAFRFAAISATSLLVCFLILIPLPLFFSSVIYGVAGLKAWVYIGIAWIFAGCGAVVIYPVFESRKGIAKMFTNIIKDIFGRRPGEIASVYEGA